MLTNKIWNSDWSIIGGCESFKELLQNLEELIRRTAKLEQMNWSNTFETPLLIPATVAYCRLVATFIVDPYQAAI